MLSEAFELMRVRWRVIVALAVAGALVFMGYAWLASSAGSHQGKLIYRLTDGDALAAQYDLPSSFFDDFSADADAALIADAPARFVDPAADDARVRATVTPISDPDVVEITVTGSRQDVEVAVTSIREKYVEYRKEALATTIDDVVGRLEQERAVLQEQLDGYDEPLEALEDDVPVLREELQLQRLDVVERIQDAQRNATNLARLRDSGFEPLTLVLEPTVEETGAIPLPTAAVLGFVFGLLVGLLVALTYHRNGAVDSVGEPATP